MKSDQTRVVACSGLTAALAAVLMLVAAGVSPVAAQTPTAEQIRIFQSLPPQQRNQIMQQMGIDPSALGGGGGAGAGGISNEIIVTQPDVRPAEVDADELTPPAQRRIRGGDHLLLSIEITETSGTETLTEITPDGRQIIRQQTLPSGRTQRTPEDLRRITAMRDRLLRRNPYELTRYGVLQLPGIEAIPLAGLTRREIEERLRLDPALSDLDIGVTVLRLTPQGERALKPFGYDMFRAGATAFVPGTDIPAPADYVLGPGDVMEIQLYGQTSQTYSLPVSRDGAIRFPELGPISVGGMRFGAARSLLEQRVQQQMIGTQARVTVSELRSVRVMVLGDAQRPGSVVVTGQSTATNALFASGGVKPIGSLRRIEIKRGNKLLRTLDLYDVLLKGDTADDVRLESGDAVFVPPVGPTVAMDGEIRRPAVYELLAENSLSDAIQLAGGLTPEADGGLVTIERIQGGVRHALMVDLGTAAAQQFKLQAGDQVRVGRVRPVVENGLTLQGHVHRPGVYAYRSGMRITDLLGSADDLKPNADLAYVLIRREAPGARRVSVVSADLAAALQDPGSPANIALAPRDVITAFDSTSPRETFIDPILEELERQAGPEDLTAVVTVGGRVNAGGRYPLEPGMRVSDLIRAGGGLEDAAYAMTAELTRYYVVQGERRRAELMQVDLRGARAGDRGADVELQAYDVLMVQETPEWGRVEQVELAGEVRFPGIYQIRRGETLSSVVDRAGGLTPLAFPEGAIFTRDELKRREREQLDMLADRLQSDIAVLSLQASQTNPSAITSIQAGQSLLEQLRQAQPVGRLVIELQPLLEGGAATGLDIMLRQGDRLIVPRLAQEVSVLGEVQNPTSHLVTRNLTRDDVIGLSGGFTSRADRGRTYVVRADGSVVGNTSRWFGRGDVGVRPGDTVVVPVDAERMRPLPLWTAVTTIIYNLAVTAAAIGSL